MKNPITMAKKIFAKMSRNQIYLIYFILMIILYIIINHIRRFTSYAILFVIFIAQLFVVIGGIIASFYTKGSGGLKFFKCILSLFGFGPLVIYDAMYM